MFLEIFFTILLIADLLLMISVLGIAIILLKSSRHNAIYFNFGMANLLLFLWIASVIIGHIGLLEPKFNVQLSYLAGLFLAHYFFLFTYYFPHKKKVNERWVLAILYASTFLFGLFIFSYPLIIWASANFPFQYIHTNNYYLTIYFAYFICLSFSGLYNLYKGWQESVSFKQQSRKILIGTFTIVIINCLTTFTASYFFDSDLTPIGILFTVLFIIYTYNILYPEFFLNFNKLLSKCLYIWQKR